MPGKGFNGLSGPPSTCDGGANGLAMARLLKIGRIFKIFKVLRIAKLVKMGNDSAIAGAISASRCVEAPSRHRRDSCPSDEVVGSLFFEFEAISGPRRPAQSSSTTSS